MHDIFINSNLPEIVSGYFNLWFVYFCSKTIFINKIVFYFTSKETDFHSGSALMTSSVSGPNMSTFKIKALELHGLVQYHGFTAFFKPSPSAVGFTQDFNPEVHEWITWTSSCLRLFDSSYVVRQQVSSLCGWFWLKEQFRGEVQDQNMKMFLRVKIGNIIKSVSLRVVPGLPVMWLLMSRLIHQTLLSPGRSPTEPGCF